MQIVVIEIDKIIHLPLCYSAKQTSVDLNDEGCRLLILNTSERGLKVEFLKTAWECGQWMGDG